MFKWISKLITNSKEPASEATYIFNAVDIDQLSTESSDGDDGERLIRIVPIGYFPNHAVPHEITREHIEQLAVNAKDSGTDILFDYEHKSLWGDTKAAGWSDRAKVEARDDGLYIAYPKFTPAAEEAINAKEYRYLSPVYRFGQRDKQGREIGIVLHSVGLTNTPYMDKEIDHIGNSQFHQHEPDNRTDMKLSKENLSKLGLKEDASEKEINDAIANSKFAEASNDDDAGDETTKEKPVVNSSTTSSAEDERISALEKRIADKEAADHAKHCESIVNSKISDGSILPSDKEIWLNSLKTDFEGTKKRLDERKANSAMPGKVTVSNSTDQGDEPKNGRKEFRDYVKNKMAAE